MLLPGCCPLGGVQYRKLRVETVATDAHLVASYGEMSPYPKNLLGEWPSAQAGSNWLFQNQVFLAGGESPRSMLTNQGLRGLFCERFWKDVFPVPVGPGIGVLL